MICGDCWIKTGDPECKCKKKGVRFKSKRKAKEVIMNESAVAVAVAFSADDQALEKNIQEKGLAAPRLTPGLIDERIASAQYHVFNGVLTVCCLTLKNGFTVTGESACVSLDNFDAELGGQIAFRNAREKIWLLEGYLLKERLNQ